METLQEMPLRFLNSSPDGMAMCADDASPIPVPDQRLLLQVIQSNMGERLHDCGDTNRAVPLLFVKEMFRCLQKGQRGILMLPLLLLFVNGVNGGTGHPSTVSIGVPTVPLLFVKVDALLPSKKLIGVPTVPLLFVKERTKLVLMSRAEGKTEQKQKTYSPNIIITYVNF
eukprot:2633531-Amphidinium_carterae.7